MKLTRQMVYDGRSLRGGWNKRQLAVLGVTWPPRKGWLDRIEGTEIAEITYLKFMRAKRQ
jgi:hypothetical protein